MTTVPNKSIPLHTLFWSFGLGILCCLSLTPSPTWALSADTQCLKMYRQKKFVKAGGCFESVVKALGQTQALSQSQKNYKGRMLRNAAISYRKHAKKGTPEKGVKWRLRAIALLETYLQEKLCEDPERCRITKGLSDTIQSEIGYAPFVIITGHPQAKVELVGSNYKQSGSGKHLKWKIPPGAYVLTVTIPQQPIQTKNVVVKANITQMVSFAKPAVRIIPRPPQPPKASSPAPWIVMGVGLAVAVTGAIVLGVGQAQEDGIHNDAQSFRTKQELTAANSLALQQRHAANGPMFPAGWIVASVGVAVAISGGIWGAVQ